MAFIAKVCQYVECLSLRSVFPILCKAMDGFWLLVYEHEPNLSVNFAVKWLTVTNKNDINLKLTFKRKKRK